MALRLLAVAAAVSALDRPTSRFQNAFGNRGSSVRRKRTLPVYRPADSPATPLPVPGSSRTLRYQPEGAANAQLVRDLQQYGALVVVIGDGDDEPIGCVVDVRLAEVRKRRPCVFTRLLERRCRVVYFSNSRPSPRLSQVSDEGQAAVVASCTSSNARVSLGRIAKAFPYTAREVSTLEDTDFLYADDVLAAYDVVEDDEPSTSKARTACVDLLEATLELCDALRPTLGKIDAFGAETAEGEYARMKRRLLEAVAKDDDEVDEERDRRLSFFCLSLVDAPDELRRRCLATRSAARRYAAIQRFLRPLHRELSAACALGASSTPPPPTPCPVDAPLAFAALRPGRRLAYWWSDAAGWCAGECGVLWRTGDAEDGSVEVKFDSAPGETGSVTQRLELLGADRGRWKLLPL